MKKIIVILLVLICHSLNAQSLINGDFTAISGSYANANAQLDFNVGEGVIGNLISPNSMLTIGTLQPEYVLNVIPTTQIRTVDCGKLNLSPDAQIAAIPVVGASLYHFEFKEVLSGNVYSQRITSSFVISPNMTMPVLQWNQQYLVRVKVFMNGQWGEFGNSCTIGLMQDPVITGIALTSIRSQYCNIPNTSIATTIVCNPVSMANRYEFKFTNTQNGNISFYQSLTTSCPLSLVNPILNTGSNYIVQVRAKVYTTWGIFGSNCNININAPQIANREEEIASNLEQEIYIDKINLDAKLSVYPNPFYEQTNLFFESNINEAAIFYIHDLQGKLISRFTGFTNNVIPISIELMHGSYILSGITNSGLQLHEKILKIN